MALKTHHTVLFSRLVTVTQTSVRLFSVYAARISALAPHSYLERPLHPRTPQPVVLHASVSVRRGPRPAHTPLSRPRTAGWRIHPSLHSSAHRYALVRAHRHADPVFTGVRLVSIRNRHTLAHDSCRQGGIPLMLSERAYPGEDGCARSARAAPNMPPAAALFSIYSSSTSSFPCSHLHASQASRTRRPSSTSGARRNSRVRPFTRTVLRIPGRQWGTRACGGVYGA
jgi:hypothetical protein